MYASIDAGKTVTRVRRHRPGDSPARPKQRQNIHGEHIAVLQHASVAAGIRVGCFAG
jgi:hypothetical protein